MPSPFQFPGGSSNLVRQIITGTSPTIITFGQSGTGQGQFNIVWLRCNEYAGGTPALTVEVYDVANTTSHYLGSNGSTWKAKALTALQSVLFDDGIVVPNGHQLRVTASVANQVMITGVYVGKQTTPQNWVPTGGR